MGLIIGWNCNLVKSRRQPLVDSASLFSGDAKRTHPICGITSPGSAPQAQQRAANSTWPKQWSSIEDPKREQPRRQDQRSDGGCGW